MDIQTLFLCAMLGLIALCMIYLAPRVAAPALAALKALGNDSDSLTQKVFPILGFLGATGIILKLTLF